MSILINNFKIVNNGTQLNINVETDLTYNIASISFWQMNDFKNPVTAISLDSYLSQSNNIEDITINAVDIGLVKFEDLCFIEVTSTFEEVDECGNLLSPAIGITYDLSNYYTCLLDNLLKIPLDCTTCDTNKINQMVITINMLIDSTIKAVDIGYYTEAINMINKLKKLCSLNSTSTSTIQCSSCNNFIQI